MMFLNFVRRLIVWVQEIEDAMNSMTDALFRTRRFDEVNDSPDEYCYFPFDCHSDEGGISEPKN
jgi:hypothetical protein